MRTREETPSGALRRFATLSAIASSDIGEAVSVVACGALASLFGRMTIAPAQSRPSARISPKESFERRSSSSAIARLDSPSGRRPSKNDLVAPGPKGTSVNGRPIERRGYLVRTRSTPLLYRRDVVHPDHRRLWPLVRRTTTSPVLQPLPVRPVKRHSHAEFS